MRRRQVCLLALVATLGTVTAACTMDTPATQPSMVPLIDPAKLPIATPAPPTSAVLLSDSAVPLIGAVPDGQCAFSDAIDGGEVTFVVGDHLIGASVDGITLRCLAALTTAQRSPARWSPIANRVLLGNDTIIDITGTRPARFDPAGPRAEWEYPNGDNLIAPSASGFTVTRRAALDTSQQSDVTFLASTTQVISHPSGQLLIAVGTARDRSRGIFIASPQGQTMRPVLLLRTAKVNIADVAADPAGDSLYFVDSSGSNFRVRRLTLTDLSVADIATVQDPAQQLTPGVEPGSVAWRAGLCNSIAETYALDSQSAKPVLVGTRPPMKGKSISPVGWLDASRLVVIARPIGCDGPGDIWIWNKADTSATLLVQNVAYPSIRLLHTPAAAPNIDIGAQPLRL